MMEKPRPLTLSQKVIYLLDHTRYDECKGKLQDNIAEMQMAQN